MNYICELYVTCDMYVESCTILVVCWLNRDPSWYSTDYQVYMGSSMTVRPLVDRYCTCALINWMVLLHGLCFLEKWNYRFLLLAVPSLSRSNEWARASQFDHILGLGNGSSDKGCFCIYPASMLPLAHHFKDWVKAWRRSTMRLWTIA